MNFKILETQEELRIIYGEPLGLAVNKQKSELDEYSEKFLNLSPFLILSTSSKSGLQDCSPRGDYPGFIQKIDSHTIAIPDRPGNNRLDSLSNIIDNPNVGVLALVPGFGECIRINGTAKISTDKMLLSKFKFNSKYPISVILISILEIYFHCTKPIRRSNLWNPDFNVDRKIMPSFGRILMGQIDPTTIESEIKEVEELIEHRAKTTLY